MQEGGATQGLAQGALRAVRSVVASSIAVVVGALITVFFLFYFLRDRGVLLSAVQHFLPLSRDEIDEVLQIVHATIEAIVYGTLVVSAVQGVLGGLAFWYLDLPAPLLGGAVMALLSVLPLFGSALVWGPAALYLALTGQVGSALMLVAWGALVVGLVDNVLKPVLVRGRMRLHTLPVFIAVLGGVAVFGGTGLVLGPVILAVAMGLLDVWRRRLAVQGTAEAVPDETR
jgi:predicted PurR-regulated permease PerM